MLQVVVAIAFSATVLFSLAEGALRDYSPTKLQDRIRGRKSADKTLRTLVRSDLMLFTTGVAAGLSRLLFVLALAFLAPDKNLGTFLALIGIAVAVILVVGSLIPRQIAEHNAEKVLLLTLPLVRVASAGLGFLETIVSPIARAISRLLRLEEEQSIEEEVEDDILSAVHDGQREGVIREDEKEMIEGIIDLKDEDVADNMTPRTEMFSIQVDTEIADVILAVNEAGHSRVPVYGENRDNILGILYVKDLLKFWGELDRREKSLRDILRTPVFVPETKKIGELLTQFRTNRVHLAVVVDEYGGTAGIITIEDILEEIVGEIRDEFDPEQPEEPTITMTSEHSAVVDARVHMMDLNEKLHLHLPEDEGFDTVGGFVCSLAGHVPAKGEEVVRDDVKFTVLAADDRRIHSLRITLPQPAAE